MPLRAFVTGLLAALSLTLSARPSPADEAQDGVEPRLEMALEIDGKRVPVSFDEPFFVGAGAERRATLRVAPTRLFARGPIRFRYAREYVFAYSEDSADSPTSWTFSGKDTSIMLFRVGAAGPSPAENVVSMAVDKIVARSSGANAKTRPVSIALGGRTLSGKRIETNVQNVILRQDVVGFRARGEIWMLILRDLPREGAATPEAERVLALLKETFVIAE
jgi:hypothetical protein